MEKLFKGPEEEDNGLEHGRKGETEKGIRKRKREGIQKRKSKKSRVYHNSPSRTTSPGSPILKKSGT